MPRYEFFWRTCEQSSAKMPIAQEYEEGRAICPNFGSDDVEERRKALYPINYKETA